MFTHFNCARDYAVDWRKIALAIKKFQQAGGWCETNEIEVRLATSMWDLANSMWDLVNSSAQLFGLGLDSGSALSLRLLWCRLKSFCHSIRHCSASLAWRHGFLTRRCPLARAAGRGRGCCPLAGLLSHSLVRRILHLVRSVWERQGWERQGFPIGCDGCDSSALCNRSLNYRVPTWMSPLEKSTLKYLGALQCRLLLQLPGCWICEPFFPPSSLFSLFEHEWNDEVEAQLPWNGDESCASRHVGHRDQATQLTPIC